jgi:prepilin-type processing-associated H-X9-DG protein
LILPAVSKVRNTAVSTICLSNLRQIGAAITLYAQDNSGYLPGPLFSTQVEWYSSTTKYPDGKIDPYGSMAGYLAPYLGLPPISAISQQASVFMCPSFLKRAPNGTSGPAYSIQQVLDLGGKVLSSGSFSGTRDVNPWGYPPSSNYLTTGGPIKMTQLSEAMIGYNTSNGTLQGQMNQTWAITDADKLIGNASASWYSELPATPVHGAYRNALFFDWHAEQVPTSAIVQ